MPYVSRLIADSGLTFHGQPSTVAPAGQTSEAIEATALERDETVVLSRWPSEPSSITSPQTKPAEITLGREAMPFASSGVETPPSPTPLAEVRPLEGRRHTASGSLPGRGDAAVPGQSAEPAETKEEQILRTLAVVRQWTATGFPGNSETPFEVATEEQLSPQRRDPDIDADPAEVVIRAEASQHVPASIRPTETSRTIEPAEPEVVNVTLSIGAIELTLEAPEAQASSHARQAAQRPGPAAPDAEALLRRHYVRPSAGW